MSGGWTKNVSTGSLLQGVKGGMSHLCKYACTFCCLLNTEFFSVVTVFSCQRLGRHVFFQRLVQGARETQRKVEKRLDIWWAIIRIKAVHYQHLCNGSRLKVYPRKSMTLSYA